MKGGDDLMLAVSEGLKKRKPASAMADDAPDSERVEGDERQHLEEIAADMIEAFKGGDAKALADLLQEAHECCATMPEEPAGE